MASELIDGSFGTATPRTIVDDDNHRTRPIRKRDQQSVRLPFPPLRTDLSGPKGLYLDPKTSSSEGGASYISRSGFRRWATSSEFVENLTCDTRALLDDFAQSWSVVHDAQEKGLTGASAMEDENYALGKRKRASERVGRTAHTDEQDGSASPFQLFARLYSKQGWHRAQLFWSEHEPTRKAMYETWIRILTHHFDPLSHADGPVARDTILRAVGALFALHLARSTAVLSKADRACPGAHARIPIEANLLQALYRLPRLVVAHFSSTIDADGMRSTDDVVFILRDMLGYHAPRAAQPDAQSYFDVLVPAVFNARPPLTDNGFSTKGECDRRRMQCGSLINAQDGRRSFLTRGECMHAFARQMIGMPHVEPRSTADNVDRNSYGPDASTTSIEHALTLLLHQPQRSSDNKMSIPVPTAKETDRIEGQLAQLAEKQETYTQQCKAAFGAGGITGQSFLQSTAAAAQELGSLPTADALSTSCVTSVETVRRFASRAAPVSASSVMNYARSRAQFEVLVRLRHTAILSHQRSQGLYQGRRMTTSQTPTPLPSASSHRTSP